MCGCLILRSTALPFGLHNNLRTFHQSPRIRTASSICGTRPWHQRIRPRLLRVVPPPAQFVDRHRRTLNFFQDYQAPSRRVHDSPERRALSLEIRPDFPHNRDNLSAL